MQTQVEKFSEFYENWFGQLDEYLQELLRVSKEGSSGSSEQEQQALVSKMTAHIKEYYTVKWAAAHEDVLAFFSPVWLSSFELAYSWFTGWKPSSVFRLVDSVKKTRVPGPSLAELTEEQLKRIEQLRVKIRLEEEKVERGMERQQVAMADRKMVELVRLAGRVRSGESVSQVDGLVEVTLNSVKAGLEKIIKTADCARLKTLKGILEILSPLQCVDFLAGTFMVQIRLRQCGKKKDADTQSEE